MKKSFYLAASLLALTCTTVFGQPSQNSRLQTIITGAAPLQPDPVKFNLDFPGGTPKELVAAIEKAMGKPVNAIISTEDATLQMPPLKMNNVVVPQLFAALKAASRKTITVPNGYPGSYSTYTGDYGFETADYQSDASIWYFHANKPVVPLSNPLQKVCQFYSLSPYLNRGFTVDDITTAIQTGWKMAGINPTPELNYHKETSLLIAFGEPYELKIINDVLATLPELQQVYWQQMNKDVFQLQQQVKELQGKIAAPSTNASPMEKSGK